VNYQIEHHLFPDMTMRQYELAQPEVERICRAHGVPYVQHSVWKRLVMLFDVATGRTKMRVWEEEAGDPPHGERARWDGMPGRGIDVAHSSRA